MINHSHDQVSDFRKEMDDLRKDFNTKFKVKGNDLTKTVEITHSTINIVNKFLTKWINEVKAKVVAEAIGTIEEIATAAANTEITNFATKNLRDYVLKIFNSLLDEERVTSHSEIEALHNDVVDNEDTQKNFVSNVTQLTTAANLANAEMKNNISSHLSSRDKMNERISSL